MTDESLDRLPATTASGAWLAACRGLVDLERHGLVYVWLLLIAAFSLFAPSFVRVETLQIILVSQATQIVMTLAVVVALIGLTPRASKERLASTTVRRFTPPRPRSPTRRLSFEPESTHFLGRVTRPIHIRATSAEPHDRARRIPSRGDGRGKGASVPTTQGRSFSTGAMGVHFGGISIYNR
jgi:hypothetical protein